MKSKKVRLEPTQEQEQFFWRFSRVNRITWNACKAKFDEVYTTEKKYLSLKELREYIRDLRNNDPKFSDFQGVPVAVTSQSIKDLLDAYKRFYSARKKKEYDPKKPNKFKPKFKKYNKTTPSFYQRIDGIHKTDDTHIKLTGIKTPVKCTALRNVDLPDKIQNPRIIYDGKYWYLSYSFEAEPQTETSQSSEETLGIDVGIKDLAVLSNGKHYSNINQETKIGKLNKRLKRLQRQVSRKYEKNATYDSQGRKIYHKTNNIKKLERRIKLLKRRIHNIQQNYIYEVINDILAIHPKTIVVENLNLRGMLKNRNLARSIQEQSLFQFRRILSYKCTLASIELRIANQWYPSSKKCSRCGNLKKGLKLSHRTYHCEACGLTIDRDENAAINLKNCDQFEVLNLKKISQF